jgi:hypothetical protein
MAYNPPAGILIGTGVDATEKDVEILAFVPQMFTDIDELGKTLDGPALVPIGIVRSQDPSTHQTFSQMLDVWIAPEISRRIASGTPPEAFATLTQALVVFPPQNEPERHIVLLNDEVQVGATVRPAYNSSLSGWSQGEVRDLRLGDMFDLRETHLEGVNIETDGFAWLRPEGRAWTMYFNFLPNSGFSEKLGQAERERFMRAIRDAIAQEMLRVFARGVLTEDPGIRAAMAADGWCPTPILLPNPWIEMCEAYRQGNAAAAEALAVTAIGAAELNKMIATWVAEEPFTSDRRFLETGVERYLSGDYISAVSVLLPRIEGIANRVREKRGIGARDSISQVLKSLDQLASAEVRDGYLAQQIRAEFEALIGNFLLAQFRPSAPGAEAVRGRHAHAHGATGDAHYDRAYALKIILALDALFFVGR